MIYFSDFRTPTSGPTVNANYMYAANLDTSEVYYQKGQATAVVPASLTKMAASLVIMQEKGLTLSDTLTVTSGDLSGLSGFTQMGLTANDVINYQDILYGIMLESGSDASQAAARVIGNSLSGGGGVSRFVTEMNAICDAIGMSSTNFTNSYGNDDTGNNVSTVSDLWLLLREFSNNATLSEIANTSTQTATITGTNARSIFMSNTHPILEDSGVVGTKTGTYLGLSGDPAIYNLATVWIAPNGQRIGIIACHSDSPVDRVSDTRTVISQLQIDFPELSASSTNGSGKVLLENGTDRLMLEDASSFVLLEA